MTNREWIDKWFELTHPNGRRPMSAIEFREQMNELWAVNNNDAYIIHNGERFEIKSIHYDDKLNIVVEASK